eukprot:6172177-Pleurochrysis_carterae.AAC.3
MPMVVALVTAAAAAGHCGALGGSGSGAEARRDLGSRRMRTSCHTNKPWWFHDGLAAGALSVGGVDADGACDAADSGGLDGGCGVASMVGRACACARVCTRALVGRGRGRVRAAFARACVRARARACVRACVPPPRLHAGAYGVHPRVPRVAAEVEERARLEERVDVGVGPRAHPDLDGRPPPRQPQRRAHRLDGREGRHH